VHKKPLTWTVKDLSDRFPSIDFPEYQREPTVWDRAAKQLLVDSILRKFDIASLYMYKDKDGTLDCIDGRQRIGAIMSFLGQNLEDPDNCFALRLTNEVYEDQAAEQPFLQFNEMPLSEIERKTKEEKDKVAQQLAQQLIAELMKYELTVVELSDSRRPAEFNLQFTRLNLGAILNSGERLHAMIGDLRDECFGSDKVKGLGEHPFLEASGVQTGRFGKEQVAAQILTQILELDRSGSYVRTRHFDLQRLFKVYSAFDKGQKALVKRVRGILDLLAIGFKEGVTDGLLRSRALTVSMVLLAWKLQIKDESDAKKLATFSREFICRSSWQLKRRLKGLAVDPEFRYLLEFQRHVTQASVEKSAVIGRASTLESEYALWQKHHAFTGDREYERRTTKKASEMCSQPV